MSGIPEFSLPPDTVYYGWVDDVLAEPLTIEDGAIPVPEGPGLGVTVDESKIAEHEIR